MAKKYRIKLDSGRVIGPLIVAQVVELFSKGHIHGKEEAQLFPGGDWKSIKHHQEIESEIYKQITKQEDFSDEDEDATSFRIELASKVRKESKQKKEDENKVEVAKIEKLDKESKELHHKEFEFKKEKEKEVGYDELEKNYQEKEELNKAVDTSEDVDNDEENNDSDLAEDQDLIEKTRLIRRSDLKQDIEHTVVIQRDEIPLLETPEELEEEVVEEVEEKPVEEVVSSDESTQFIDINNLLPELKKEAKNYEQELVAVDISDDKKEEIEIEEEDDEEETDNKKKLRPIAIIAIIAILAVLFHDEVEEKENINPVRVQILSPITDEIASPKEAKELFKEGALLYEQGVYLSKVKASASFRKSVEKQFSDNPALGYLIMVYGELIANSSNVQKSASVLFNLIKYSRSKILKDANMTIGAALFYSYAEKHASAIKIIENYLKISNPTPKLYSVYIELLIKNGDLDKVKKKIEKLKAIKRKPVRGYLALSSFYKLDEEYDKGLEIVKKGLNLYPQNVGLLLEYSEYILRNQDFRTLNNILKKIKVLKAENSPEYFARYLEYLGILTVQGKNVKTAALLFSTALKISKSNSLRSKLAELEVGGGQLSERLILESKAIDLIRKSKIMIKENKWKQAFQYALDAVDINRNYIPARIHFANLQSKRGYFQSAIETFETLKREFPKNAEISFMYLMALVNARKLDEAQQEVHRISNTKLKFHPDFYGIVARFYEKKERNILAVNFLRQSIDENPLRDEDYFLMAKIYMKKRQYKQAKKKLNDALTLDPLNIEYHSLFSKVLYDLEGTETAIGYLRDLLEDNPDNPVILGDIATFYYKSGQVKSFEFYKEKLKKLTNRDASFYKFMIESAIANENDLETIEYAKELVRINPSDMETRLLLGKYLAKNKKFREALGVFNSIKERLESYPKIHYFMSKVYLETKAYKKALAMGEKEIELNPGLYHGYYAVGEAHRQMKNYVKAKNNLEKAVQKNAKNVESLIALGWINRNQNYLEVARELYIRAKREDEYNPYIRKELGLIYERIGQGRLAVEELEAYLKLFPNAPDREQVQKLILIIRR
jgi:tetratricopeptide (TPR) repeat protein